MTASHTNESLRVNLIISSKDDEALDRLSAKLGLSRSEIVRRSVAAFDDSSVSVPRADGPQSWGRWERVGPEEAKLFLAKISPRQRKLRAGHVAKIARDMESGNWRFDGMPVRISPTGELLDGMHRLNAVETSGETVWMFVMRHVDEDSFEVMDGGRPRTWADNNAVSSKLAAAVALAYFWEIDKLECCSRSDLQPTMSERSVIFDRYREIGESLQRVGGLNGVLRGGEAVFFDWVFRRTDTNLAEWFMARLKASPTESVEPLMPVFHLRKRLLESAMSKLHIDRGERLALIIKCWNMTRDGKDMRILRWSSAEGFPRIK